GHRPAGTPPCRSPPPAASRGRGARLVRGRAGVRERGARLERLQRLQRLERLERLQRAECANAWDWARTWSSLGNTPLRPLAGAIGNSRYLRRAEQAGRLGGRKEATAILAHDSIQTPACQRGTNSDHRVIARSCTFTRRLDFWLRAIAPFSD